MSFRGAVVLVLALTALAVPLGEGVLRPLQCVLAQVCDGDFFNGWYVVARDGGYGSLPLYCNDDSYVIEWKQEIRQRQRASVS